MTTWDRGRADVTKARMKAEGPLDEFVARMHRGSRRSAGCRGRRST